MPLLSEVRIWFLMTDTLLRFGLNGSSVKENLSTCSFGSAILHQLFFPYVNKLTSFAFTGYTLDFDIFSSVLFCSAVRSSWLGLQKRFAGEKQHSYGIRLWTCTWYLRKRHVWNYFGGKFDLWWGLLFSRGDCLNVLWTKLWIMILHYKLWTQFCS